MCIGWINGWEGVWEDVLIWSAEVLGGTEWKDRCDVAMWSGRDLIVDGMCGCKELEYTLAPGIGVERIEG